MAVTEAPLGFVDDEKIGDSLEVCKGVASACLDAFETLFSRWPPEESFRFRLFPPCDEINRQRANLQYYFKRIEKASEVNLMYDTKTSTRTEDSFIGAYKTCKIEFSRGRRISIALENWELKEGSQVVIGVNGYLLLFKVDQTIALSRLPGQDKIRNIQDENKVVLYAPVITSQRSEDDQEEDEDFRRLNDMLKYNLKGLAPFRCGI